MTQDGRISARAMNNTRSSVGQDLLTFLTTGAPPPPARSASGVSKPEQRARGDLGRRRAVSHSWPRPLPLLAAAAALYKRARWGAGQAVVISAATLAGRSPSRGAVLFLSFCGLRDWRISVPWLWINLVCRMKLVSLTLFYLGSVSFFGVEAAQLDIASDLKRKSRWALSRVSRDAMLTKADANVPSLLHVRELKGEPSRREESHIRLKRYDHNSVFYTHLRVSCKMGTCSVAKLADQLYHLNNKDKDANAPPRKLSPHGYGRRRRSILDILAAL
ncbi:pro-adrenomedullin [Paroedura picta]|uniref:pro-adrenomedullin n=1 Tax=Paroedura picta TaxID=143630 RepID=UPI00405720A7